MTARKDPPLNCNDSLAISRAVTAIPLVVTEVKDPVMPPLAVTTINLSPALGMKPFKNDRRSAPPNAALLATLRTA
jgi:hypothetical protein